MVSTKQINSYENTGQNPVNTGVKYWAAITKTDVSFYTALPRVPISAATTAQNLQAESYVTADQYDSVMFRDLKQVNYPVEPPFAFLPFTYTVGVVGRFRVALPLFALNPSHQVKFKMHSANITGDMKVTMTVNERQTYVFDPITTLEEGIVQSYNLQEQNIVVIECDGLEAQSGEIVNFEVEFLNHDLSKPLLTDHDDTGNEAKNQIFTSSLIEEVRLMDTTNSLVANPVWDDIVTFIQTLVGENQTFYLAS